MVSLQLAVGLRMEGRCQDVLDTHHAQVVPEGPGYIAGAIVAQEPGPRSSIGIWSMPVLSTASWTTSMKESDVISL